MPGFNKIVRLLHKTSYIYILYTASFTYVFTIYNTIMMCSPF